MEGKKLPKSRVLGRAGGSATPSEWAIRQMQNLLDNAVCPETQPLQPSFLGKEKKKDQYVGTRLSSEVLKVSRVHLRTDKPAPLHLWAEEGPVGLSPSHSREGGPHSAGDPGKVELDQPAGSHVPWE